MGVDQDQQELPVVLGLLWAHISRTGDFFYYSKLVVKNGFKGWGRPPNYAKQNSCNSYVMYGEDSVCQRHH